MKKSFYMFMFMMLLTMLVGCGKNKVYEKENNYIYFGSYPQSLLTDEATIKKLEEKDLTDKWISYNYYINEQVVDYMFYTDIDLDNDGSNDYRGVYFTSYRPPKTTMESDMGSSEQHRNGYLIDKVYWFKYEKIKWEILKNKKNKMMLIANIILDSQDYSPYYGVDIFYHNGGEGYMNNYELSTIRSWLNKEFYNWAFNDLEKEIVLTTEIDNSLESTTRNANRYVCSNTFDKVTLLSHKEVYDFYPSMQDRKRYATDYAKCQGITVSPNSNSNWRLRTPYTNSMERDTFVNFEGDIYNYSVNNTFYGIRPVIWIKK